jgi:hypothetical protein
MADVQASVLVQEQGDTFIDVLGGVDGAGNSFVGVVTTGNDNYVIVRRYTPAGQGAVIANVLPAPGGTEGYKIDAAYMTHSGVDVIVDMITHDATSIKPRGIRVERAVIRGVWVPRLQEEEGGAGAFVGSGSGGGDVEVDYDRIKSDTQAIVDAAVHSIKGQDNITLRVVIDNISVKAKKGVEELFDGGNGSAIVYQQLTNTSFTGSKGANHATIKDEFLKP